MTAQYPYFKPLQNPPIKPIHAIEDKESETVWQIFGPNEQKIPYTLQLYLTFNGRQIDHVTTEIGWLHRGLEKQAEHTPYTQLPTLLGQLNPLQQAPLQIACELALYQLANEEVSTEQNLQHELQLEISRLKHHMMVTRQLFENAELYRSLSLFGTLHIQDRPNLTQAEQCLTFLEQHQRMLCLDSTIKKRLSKRGLIQLETALQYGITGPTLKACQTQDGSDVFVRHRIRYHEMIESLKKSITVLKLLKDKAFSLTFQTPHTFSKPQMASVFINAPEGELALYIEHLNGDKPNRVRLKSPSFALASAIPHFLKGADIDDVVLILISLGLNMGEIDR